MELALIATAPAVRCCRCFRCHSRVLLSPPVAELRGRVGGATACRRNATARTPSTKTCSASAASISVAGSNTPCRRGTQQASDRVLAARPLTIGPKKNSAALGRDCCIATATGHQR